MRSAEAECLDCKAATYGFGSCYDITAIATDANGNPGYANPSAMHELEGYTCATLKQTYPGCEFLLQTVILCVFMTRAHLRQSLLQLIVATQFEAPECCAFWSVSYVHSSRTVKTYIGECPTTGYVFRTFGGPVA